MTEAVTVELRHGLRRGDGRRGDATVRALSGLEEELLAGGELAGAARATEVLARCVDRLGDERRPVAHAALCELTVGDREALLLAVFRCTFGDHLDLVAACPACAASLDLHVAVADLLPAGAGEPAEQHVLETGGVRVTFRLPTGADQEAAAEAADVDAAVAALLDRCVLDVMPEAAVDDYADALGDRIAELDPEAEAVLDVGCEACGERFAVPLDAGDLLAGEAAARSGGLLRDVHQLALGYHWSERDILGLSTPRRRQYLALLDEAL
jgi:hypothetical protein